MIKALARYKIEIIGFSTLVLAGLASDLVAVVLGALIFLLLLLKKRYLTFFTFFYLVLFFSDSRSPIFSFTTNLKPILSILFGLAGLFIGVKRGLVPRWLTPFFIFLAWSAGLIALSPVPFQSFQKTLSYFFIFLSVPVLLHLNLEHRGKQVLKHFIFLAFILLVMGLLLRILFPGFVLLVGRYRGLLGNPNGLGLFLTVQFLLFQVVTYKWPQLFTKIELRWLYIVFFLSVILSRSRTAIGVFIAFYLLSWIYRKSPFLGLLVSIGLIFLWPYFVGLVPELIIDFGLGDYFRIETLSEGSGRTVAWSFAWMHIQEHYFLGRGFDYTEYLFYKHREVLNMMNHQGNAHNSYLTFWLNTGLVGLAIYSLALLNVIIKTAKKSSIALPVFTGILISSTFESWLTASLNPFTFVFLMIITLLFYEPDEDSETKLEKRPS